MDIKLPLSNIIINATDTELEHFISSIKEEQFNRSIVVDASTILTPSSKKIGGLKIITHNGVKERYNV